MVISNHEVTFYALEICERCGGSAIPAHIVSEVLYCAQCCPVGHYVPRMVN